MTSSIIGGEIKKGVPLYSPIIVNLKSNTMKNTRANIHIICSYRNG